MAEGAPADKSERKVIKPLFSSLFSTISKPRKKDLKSEEKQRDRQAEEARRREAEKQRSLIATKVKSKDGVPVLTGEPPDKNDIQADEEPILPVKKKSAHKRRNLKDLLQLAGIELDQIAVYKKVFMASVVVNLAITAVTLFMGFVFGGVFETLGGIGGYLAFAAALWTVFLAGLFIVLFLAFTVYLDLRIAQRRKEIETVFPDFLQLAAANLSAGMTVDRALWSAIRPRFGVLAKEMEDVAKKTITGHELEAALQEFSEKYDSIIIKRSVNLITEGIRSGGQMADILNKIAVNIQENAILQKEMAANVTTYVIFISFSSIIAAPFLFGLATQLLIVIKSIALSIVAQGANSGGGLGISISGNVVDTRDFRTFCLLVLTFSSIMSACMVSVIRKGSVREGIRLLPFFWFTSISLYYFSAWVLGFMFGNIV